MSKLAEETGLPWSTLYNATSEDGESDAGDASCDHQQGRHQIERDRGLGEFHEISIVSPEFFPEFKY